MSIDLTKYNHHTNSANDKRALAVSAALAVIQAKVANSPSYGSVVANEIEQLARYADQIQEALKAQ